MTTQMKVKDLIAFVNEEISLRKPSKAMVEEYARRMKDGVEFPPLIVGTWPKSDKYGSGGIVDGRHRLEAAKEAGLDQLPITEKSFETIQDALAFMYKANVAHGLPVSEGQRNARIKLIRQIDPQATIEKLAKQFGLGIASISRILKDMQGEGKSGRKGGANSSKGQKSQTPLKPSGVQRMIERLNQEFERKRPNVLADYGAYLSPASEKHPDGELDADKFEEVTTLQAYLTGLIKELK